MQRFFMQTKKSDQTAWMHCLIWVLHWAHMSNSAFSQAAALIAAHSFNPLYTEQTLPHYILEESNFNFRYIRRWDLHIPREKWINYLQTVETLIRRRILRHLIWVCTDCQLPFYGSPDYNGLSISYSTMRKPRQV